MSERHATSYVGPLRRWRIAVGTKENIPAVFRHISYVELKTEQLQRTHPSSLTAVSVDWAEAPYNLREATREYSLSSVAW